MVGMNVEELKASNKILYEVVAGSVAYGTNTPESDIDIRGIFWVPPQSYLSFNEKIEQIANNKNDIVYYTLYRFLELAQTANPNIIELLWMPEDCIRYRSPLLNPLFDQRNAFISKKAYFTHAAYAKAQIGKAKGQNKWINNPQPVERPSREDFCYLILASDYSDGVVRYYDKFGGAGQALCKGETKIDWIIKNLGMPFRPKKLSSFPEDSRKYYLNNCKVAGLEHVPNTYRLYAYGNNEPLFKNNVLVTSSIPIDDEWSKFIGLLIYNEQEYDMAVKDWQNYWTWKKERNDARWVSQERGEIDYDAKNMSHCMRLMLSAENILVNGEPIVRFAGKQLQMLKDIRAGKWQYAEIMKNVNDLSARLEEAHKSSSLPDEMNVEVANKLFQEITYACESSTEDGFCGERK